MGVEMQNPPGKQYVCHLLARWGTCDEQLQWELIYKTHLTKFIHSSTFTIHKSCHGQL